MSKTERIYFTSPDPDYFFEEGAMVAPNDGKFPIDATIQVETESHFLEFGIVPKNEDESEFAIELTYAVPALSDSPTDTNGENLIVEGDVLRKAQPFTVASPGSRMAVHSFRALKIFTNVEVLIVPVADGRA